MKLSISFVFSVAALFASAVVVNADASINRIVARHQEGELDVAKRLMESEVSCFPGDTGTFIATPIDTQNSAPIATKGKQFTVGPALNPVTQGVQVAKVNCRSTYMGTLDGDNAGFLKVGDKCITVKGSDVTLETCVEDGAGLATQFFIAASDKGRLYDKFMGAPKDHMKNIGFEIDENQDGLIVAVKGKGKVTLALGAQ